jgi:hypothetical protein
LGEITVASVGKISGKITFALDGDKGGEFYNILVNYHSHIIVGDERQKAYLIY